MSALSYAWSRDKDGGHTIRSVIAEVMLHADFMFYRTGVIAERSFTLR